MRLGTIALLLAQAAAAAPSMRLGTIAVLAAATAAPVDDVDALLRTYVKQHSSPSLGDPCDRRYVAADFWGKGLGNSVNVALNALAFAVASNRTLLISDDARFRAGFWKYLGDVERRWALKSQIRRCGPEVVRDFFPMNRRCLEEKTCGSCLLYTSPSPRDGLLSRMPSSA